MSILHSENGSLREQAYSRLRHLLILEQVPRGHRLREAQWADQLEVNRAALREAFARLEAEGLIEKGPKTGYFVPTITKADILEIVEVRIMLEGGAIERIVQLGWNTRSRLKPMFEACEQLGRLVREEYLLGVVEADRRFHEGLIDAAANRRLSMLYKRAPLPMIHPEIITGKEWRDRTQLTLEEHQTILGAVLDGSTENAKEALRIHLHERALLPPHANLA